MVLCVSPFELQDNIFSKIKLSDFCTGERQGMSTNDEMRRKIRMNIENVIISKYTV